MRWSNTAGVEASRSRRAERLFVWFCRTATYLALLGLGSLVLIVAIRGAESVFTSHFPFLDFKFLGGSPETLHVFTFEGTVHELSETQFREFLAAHHLQAGDLLVSSYPFAGGGILPAIVGSLFLVAGAMLVALTLGISAAIYLSEFAHDTRFIRLVRLSILNLAGLPSIVYGLFGFGMFVLFLDFGQSLVAGCCTLALMALPIVIISSEEALQAVPRGFRDASFALGANRWQVIQSNVLPYAWRGILSASLLGTIRVAGETAPILFTAAFAIRNRLPWEVSSWQEFSLQGVMALPFHIYYLSARVPLNNPYTERVQYGAAFVFLALIAFLALLSFSLRVRTRRGYSQ